MLKYLIPLSIPKISGNEWEYVKECLDRVSSAGKYVNLFEDNITVYIGSKYSVACTNDTSAFQVSLCLAGVQPGDEGIAHHLTTLKNCTQIVELSNGGVKRTGSYQDIVNQSAVAPQKNKDNQIHGN